MAGIPDAADLSGKEVKQSDLPDMDLESGVMRGLF